MQMEAIFNPPRITCCESVFKWFVRDQSYPLTFNKILSQRFGSNRLIILITISSNVEKISFYVLASYEMLHYTPYLGPFLGLLYVST